MKKSDICRITILALLVFLLPGTSTGIQTETEKSAKEANQENVTPPAQVSGQETVPPVEPAPQEPIVPENTRQNVTAEDIAAATADLAAATALDEIVRGSISQLLATAQKKLEARNQFETNIANYDKRIADAPAAMATANEQKTQIPGKPNVIPADYLTEQLRQVIAQSQAELDQEKSQLATLTEEPTRRVTRSGEIPGLMAKIETELAETRKQLAIDPPPGELPLQTRARRLQLGAQLNAQEKEVESLKKEQLYYNATLDLLPLQLEVAHLRVAQKSKIVDELQKALVNRQKSRLQKMKDDVELERDRAPPELKAFAEESCQMSDKILKYQERASRLFEQNKTLTAKKDDVKTQKQTAEDRFKSVGLTDALGGMLRKQRREMVQMRQRNQPHADASAETRQMQVEIFQLQDSIASMQDDETEADLLLQTLELPPGSTTKELKAYALKLFKSRRMLMSELATVSDQQFRNMVSLDIEQRKLVLDTSDFISWIDERVIWIPSAPVFATGDWSFGRTAAQWLISPANWETVRLELVSDLSTNAMAFIPFILAVVVLFLFRGRLKRIIGETGDEASKGRCARILPTMNSFAATVLMSALWPMIVTILGWTLSHGPNVGSFVYSVGQALIGVAIFMAPLELLRHVCREKGLADSHFDWPDRTRKFLALNIRSFYLFSLPLMFVQGVMSMQPNEDWKNSLGRFASCLLFVVVAWYLHSLFRPSGVIFQQMFQQRPVPGSYRFRSVIHLVAIGLPILLLLLSLAGYYYTAFQLGGCMEQSLSLLIMMTLIGGFLVRWLLVRRRALAMDEARKARLAMAAASEAKGPVGEVAMAKTESSVLDLASVSRQAREIVVLALTAANFILLYWVWRDVLPAIGILDRAELWQVTINEKVEWVTLKNLFNALFTGAFTWLMIRNMPGLLNLAVQKFSSLDSGARYAATTIFRYVITVIGTVTALSFLRIQWAQYSWLVAAVTVGLGFGLQEIVANFVSGLILLFERPVRVGDLVTIDQTNGVVSRIQMRATTVMTWDHQELIVPNKDLVTGKLLNWTLTNVTNRLVLEVGVAYGTDVDMVRDLLEESVKSHPQVLADPPVLCSFESFGDSSLNFKIRCFLPSVDRRFQTKHEINSLIAKAFYKAGISIPFPQRDLHIVSGAFPTSGPTSPNGNSRKSIEAKISKDIAADE